VINRTRQYRNDTLNQNTISRVRTKFGINSNNGSFQEQNLMLLNERFLRQLQQNIDPNPSDINVRIFQYNNMKDPSSLRNKLKVFVLTSPLRWEALRTILGSRNQAQTRGTELLKPIISAVMQDIFERQNKVNEKTFSQYMNLRESGNKLIKKLDNRYQKAYLQKLTKNTTPKSYLTLLPANHRAGGNVSNNKTVPKQSNSPRPRKLRTR